MFSLLQRHVLKECFARKGQRVGRKFFNSFYLSKKIKTKDQVNTITKCLERLIGRGFLIGYGTRTTKKWFIREVKLTKLGVKKYIEWLASRQSRLPF